MQEFLSQCRQAILDGDHDLARSLASRALADGFDLLETIDQGFSPGIREAGKRWEDGVYFLPELAFSAEAMKAAMTVLLPALKEQTRQSTSKGRVVIGTVQGDIHDIGKTLVATLLSANGYEVIDLGADVPHERFIESVVEHKPDYLCMSALLTTTMVGQRHVIEQLEQKDLRAGVRIVVGGAPTSETWARDIGADGHASSAAAATRVLESLA